MWEEDPRWQEANYRFSIAIVAVGTVCVALWSAWEREWSLLGYWALIWGVILGALLLYGASVWFACHSVAFICRQLRKVFRKGGPNG